MSCGDHDKMNPVTHALYHVKEWDKKWAKKIQTKFNLSGSFDSSLLWLDLN